jgi:PAS domain S-box-containing protein
LRDHELSGALAEAVLGTGADAIIASDSYGIITFWNRGAERIFGYASAEAVGRSLDIIIPERLRERHWSGYRRVMATGRAGMATATFCRFPAFARTVRKSRWNLRSCRCGIMRPG